MKAIKTQEFTVNNINGVVMLHSNGGVVFINSEQVVQYNFNTTNIKDLGNFLVTFLHRCGYDMPVITLDDGSVYEYSPIKSHKFGDILDEYLVINDSTGNVINIPVDTDPSEVIKQYPNMTLDALTSAKKMTVRFYSKNNAINKILNHNQLDPKFVKKYNLVGKLHENILKGHTTIPKDIQGKYFTKYGRFYNSKLPSKRKHYQVPVLD